MAKRTGLKKINEEIEKIQNSFIETSPTEQQFFKQTFGRIIIPEGKEKGKVRSYQEALKEIRKYAPESLKTSPYTLEDYYEELSSLKEILGNRLTLQGEIDYQRDYMERYINDNLMSNISSDFGDYISDFKDLTTEEILDAFREAEQRQREAKNKRYDSGRFYEYLAEALAERLYG